MDIANLPAILPTYAGWVRTLMFGIQLGWIVVYAMMVFWAPKPPEKLLSFDKLEQVRDAREPGALILDATLTNNTGAIVALTRAKLIYYQDEIVTDGLQAAQSIEATYVITESGGKFLSQGADGVQKTVETKLTAPFGGQPQMEVTLSLDQVVEDKKADRFLIMLKDGRLLDPSLNKVRATIQYGNNALSRDADLTLPP